MCLAASIEQRATGILLQFASLPSVDQALPKAGAFNALLEDSDGSLTRQRALNICLFELSSVQMNVRFAAVHSMQHATPRHMQSLCPTYARVTKGQAMVHVLEDSCQTASYGTLFLVLLAQKLQTACCRHSAHCLVWQSALLMSDPTSDRVC